MWGPWQQEYGWTVDQLNNSYALSVAGLGLGSPIFIFLQIRQKTRFI